MPDLSSSLPEERNAILAASVALRKCLPRLQPISLPREHLLIEQERRVTRVYFPISGVVSLVAGAGDGKLVEVGMVGREGIAGLPFACGADRLPVSAISQTPVTLLSLSLRDLNRCLVELPQFRTLLEGYSQLCIRELIRTLTCSHVIEQRFARWLLTKSDRLGGDSFLVTHASAARLLNVRRAGVTEVMDRFSRRGLVHSHGSEITIVNRRDLEAAACPCYSAVKSDHESYLNFLAHRNKPTRHLRG